MNTRPQGDKSQVTLRITKLRDRTTWRSASGQANVTVEGHLLNVRAGDRLRVFAMLNTSAVPRNPGEFDYRRFLRTSRQLCGLHVADPSGVVVLGAGPWWSLRRWVYALRSGCDELLWKHICHPRAPLASAVLLGAREQVDRERNEDFFVTGTVHLLAISGLHVGILAYMFWFVARTGFFPRRAAIVTTMTFVILYALLTEARPPVVRATILIVVFCTAQLLGRQALSFNTLAAAGIVVLLINPAQLFQAGTQLSFLAVATLVCCAPLLMPRPVHDPLDRLITDT
jgi:competence protein ComEC